MFWKREKTTIPRTRSLWPSHCTELSRLLSSSVTEVTVSSDVVAYGREIFCLKGYLYTWTNKTWMLHHDNAPPHASLLIREFLAKQETTVVPQPPYSPDLAPADFFLFPKLKSTLKGRRFQTVEEIKENSLQDLRAIPQNTFQDAFQNWKKSWKRRINRREEYFEGDKSY